MNEGDWGLVRGLGIKNLSIFNKALLGKWSWRYMNKREFIRGKYGEGQGGWCTKNVRVGYGVGVWKANRKEWNYVADQISFVVGEGNMVHSFGKTSGYGMAPVWGIP